MSQVFILSGCRTAIGKYLGQYEEFSGHELGAIVIKDAIKRACVQPEDVDEVIMGQVLTAGEGQNPARQASILAGLPITCPAYGVNMLCGSGLKAVGLGFQAIRNGDSQVIIAGGQESMTRAQHCSYVRKPQLGDFKMVDTLINDGLTDAFNKVHMGLTAEHVAKVYNVSRRAQEEYASKSQEKAKNAIENRYFDKETVGVPHKRTGEIISKEEFPKFNTTVEGLSKLKPCFDKAGSVTAGTSSGINDGAAAVILASQDYILTKKLTPIAKIIGYTEVGVDPMCMGTGPISAVNKLLPKIGWTKEDVDLWELNEAFAAQSIVVAQTLDVAEDKINVCGGAIALGHPIGCSGTRVLVTLIYSLERIGKKKGVAALCIGGGMGIAMAVELC